MDMSISPFASAVNARLVFKIPNGALTTDGNGNPVPTTSEIVVLALLRFGKSEVKHESGVDEVTEEVSGYVVDPIELPQEIDDLSEPAQAEIKKSKSLVLNAQFKLLPQIQNPFVLSAGVEGLSKIRGVLSYRRS
ncbi:hypothetical protein COO91_02041 [Nostoc flagelliforme CCNUN1]|uniref:Uncharacterized protein n=1 Tax=Nostoc flagelliforme CCNUN1 TaxID=2038116 RepID=A0A2K8SLA7_9NOSO|nr:hypothetical protein COO91_02041 [Nostoc flagelliforme CCNUN1]